MSVRALCIVLAAAFSLQTTGEPVPPGSIDDIRERLKPLGALCRAGEGCGASTSTSTTTSGTLSGSEVYDKFCFACHTTGVGGAPKYGDAAAWTDRAAKGMDTLWSSTLNGLNAMPAKGTCMTCSNDELRAAMDYMMGE